MKIFKPVFKGIRKPFKRIKIFLKQKAGWLGIPKILPYRGFGNNSDIYITGMVIEDKGLAKPTDSHNIGQNIMAMIKRFSGDEIPDVRIQAEFMGMSQITKTDENGFFSFHFNVDEISDTKLSKRWHTFSFRLLDEIMEFQPEVTATGEVRIVSPEEKRIIVSDIDDTVIISHSTQTIKKLRLMLLKNALTRLPFKGVESFYVALEKGKDKNSFYPFFYVSSSEWNLYDLLEDFFYHNKIPKGVFMLRKLENSIYKFWKSGQGNHQHKYEKIKFLLEFYKDQKFILIGDSGQNDPQIYTRLAHEFPGRIETIYIRKIGSKVFYENIEQLNSSLEKAETYYLQIEDTIDAARHALNNGYINKELIKEDLTKKDGSKLEIV
ncbi:MAG: phosphatase domain-containing protein [Bacteroidales bacterium]